MTCLLIIIDGCNEDYINERTTPFLYELRNKSSYITMESTPAFAAGIEIFSGLSSQTTDTFVDFRLGPGILPFQVLRVLKPSYRLNALNKYKNNAVLALHFLFTGAGVDVAHIPLSILPYFRVNESFLKNKKLQKKGTGNNLLGILKRNGYKVNFVYGTTETIDKRMGRYSRADKEVIILHYGETDYFGHKDGPQSLEIKKVLGRIDESIQKVCRLLGSDLEGMFVFGDHNMVEVTRSVDLWGGLQNLNIDLIRDYFVFLNSPMARFWFKNKLAEQKIRTFLEGFGEYGREVTKDELKHKSLPADDKDGELIFWAKKGVNFSPDFYHIQGIKGMHGYFDDADATTPLIIWSKEKRDVLRERCQLRDIAPTVLDFLSISYSQMDGKSLWM